MKDQLKAIETEALEKIAKTEDIKKLQDIKVAYLGKKGSLTVCFVEWANCPKKKDLL